MHDGKFFLHCHIHFAFCMNARWLLLSVKFYALIIDDRVNKRCQTFGHYTYIKDFDFFLAYFLNIRLPFDLEINYYETINIAPRASNDLCLYFCRRRIFVRGKQICFLFCITSIVEINVLCNYLQYTLSRFISFYERDENGKSSITFYNVPIIWDKKSLIICYITRFPALSFLFQT